jgi:hypothetical protein
MANLHRPLAHQGRRNATGRNLRKSVRVILYEKDILLRTMMLMGYVHASSIQSAEEDATNPYSLAHEAEIADQA